MNVRLLALLLAGACNPTTPAPYTGPVPAPIGDACPAERVAGGTCTTEGQACAGADDTDPGLSCVAGRWAPTPVHTPPCCKP